jgi:hypothetical protein
MQVRRDCFEYLIVCQTLTHVELLQSKIGFRRRQGQQAAATQEALAPQ